MLNARAWHAEQLRQRRAQRAYWVGLGEVALGLFLGLHAFLGLALLVHR